jgi:hypothetical protein
MALMIHDTTGTQTDCPLPLSRKKIRQLMNHNHENLSGSMLDRSIGHKQGRKVFSKISQKRQERQKKRKLFEKKTLPDGTSFQLIPNAADLLAIKPTIFESLGGFFKNLQRKFERQKARGK